MSRVLICARCGAPLPKPAASDRYVTCAFCQATSSLDGGSVAAASPDEPSWLDLKRRLKVELDAFHHSYEAALSQGLDPFAAFRAAARQHLAAVCDPDTLTDVVRGLARELERESRVKIESAPTALPRLVVGYLDALEQLRLRPEYELDLPFIAATAQGPVNFKIILTPTRLAELLASGQAPDKPKKFWGLFG